MSWVLTTDLTSLVPWQLIFFGAENAPECFSTNTDFHNLQGEAPLDLHQHKEETPSHCSLLQLHHNIAGHNAIWQLCLLMSLREKRLSQGLPYV